MKPQGAGGERQAGTFGELFEEIHRCVLREGGSVYVLLLHISDSPTQAYGIVLLMMCFSDGTAGYFMPMVIPCLCGISSTREMGKLDFYPRQIAPIAWNMLQNAVSHMIHELDIPILLHAGIRP